MHIVLKFGLYAYLLLFHLSLAGSVKAAWNAMRTIADDA